jgi:hypothetical protein
MASPINHTQPQQDGDAPLSIREDYEQAVLDFVQGDALAPEARPSPDTVGHTSTFLNNLRLPVHR